MQRLLRYLREVAAVLQAERSCRGYKGTINSNMMRRPGPPALGQSPYSRSSGRAPLPDDRSAVSQDGHGFRRHRRDSRSFVDSSPLGKGGNYPSGVQQHRYPAIEDMERPRSHEQYHYQHRGAPSTLAMMDASGSHLSRRATPARETDMASSQVSHRHPHHLADEDTRMHRSPDLYTRDALMHHQSPNLYARDARTHHQPPSLAIMDANSRRDQSARYASGHYDSGSRSHESLAPRDHPQGNSRSMQEERSSPYVRQTSTPGYHSRTPERSMGHDSHLHDESDDSSGSSSPGSSPGASPRTLDDVRRENERLAAHSEGSARHVGLPDKIKYAFEKHPFASTAVTALVAAAGGYMSYRAYHGLQDILAPYQWAQDSNGQLDPTVVRAAEGVVAGDAHKLRNIEELNQHILDNTRKEKGILEKMQEISLNQAKNIGNPVEQAQRTQHFQGELARLAKENKDFKSGLEFAYDQLEDTGLDIEQIKTNIGEKGKEGNFPKILRDLWHDAEAKRPDMFTTDDGRNHKVEFHRILTENTTQMFTN